MPKVTTGNRLYFYQLFSAKVGIGQQVSLARVEEVLAEEDVEPRDLEFETVQDLLAAMPEIFKLTVFKKGRTYATLVQNEEFDGILARLAAPAAAEKGAKGGPKTWKRKKGPKDPTPAKPHKRPVVAPAEPVLAEESTHDEADAAPEVADEQQPAASEAPEQAPVAQDEPEAPAAAEVQAAAEETADAVAEVAAVAEAAPVEQQPEVAPEQPAAPEPEPKPEAAPAEKPAAPTAAPSISLTITYDPREIELP